MYSDPERNLDPPLITLQDECVKCHCTLSYDEREYPQNDKGLCDECEHESKCVCPECDEIHRTPELAKNCKCLLNEEVSI